MISVPEAGAMDSFFDAEVGIRWSDDARLMQRAELYETKEWPIMDESPATPDLDEPARVMRRAVAHVRAAVELLGCLAKDHPRSPEAQMAAPRLRRLRHDWPAPAV